MEKGGYSELEMSNVLHIFDWILSGNHNFYIAKWQENGDLVSVLPLTSCMALDFLCTIEFSSYSAHCG